MASLPLKTPKNSKNLASDSLLRSDLAAQRSDLKYPPNSPLYLPLKYFTLDTALLYAPPPFTRKHMKSLSSLPAHFLTTLILLPILFFFLSPSQINAATWQCDYSQYAQDDCQGGIWFHGTNPTQENVNPESLGCIIRREIPENDPYPWKSLKWTSCTCIHNCDNTDPTPTPGTGTCGSSCSSNGNADCDPSFTCQNTPRHGQICWNESICGDDPNPTSPPASTPTPFNPPTPTTAIPPSNPTQLTNPSFELGNFSGWSLHGLDTTESFVVNCGTFPPCSDGQHYAKLVRVLGDQDPHLASEWIETGQNLSGKQIKVSFAIKAHNANASIRGIVIQREPKDNNWDQTTAYVPVEATANWQTKTYTVNLPTPTDGNNSTRFRVVLRPEMSLSYQLPVYYDNVQVELVTTGETTPTPTPPVTPTLPPSTSIFGDTNSDDKVDILDILNHIKNFGKTLAQGIDPLDTDINNDEQVNIFDYVFSLRDFGLSQLHFPGPETGNHIRAKGTAVDGVYPTFQLLNRFDHVILEQTVTENWKDYPFTLTLRDTIMTGYKIKFINDKGDRNLQIDYLHLHGQKLETEADTTYSTGTWNYTDRACVPGYFQSEYLHCNGYVEYNSSAPTPTPTSIVPSIIP